ncbi:MAG TPA: GNAT family N-acetyltransferase [Allosphingosinicella sp.]|nr:GNAT family N-acetyltransferase [Allosphingosinicella sp.]
MDRIVTKRLVLRRAREDDLEAMHAVLSNPVAMRYWSSLPHRELAETREWLANMIASEPGVREDFVVEFGGRVIGKAGCYQLPEIGYILHPDCWGRGLATEALTAVIAHVFERHPIPALRADIDPRNTASIRLLTKLGFVESGRAARTWHIGDEWCDSIYFTLPRPTASGA